MKRNLAFLSVIALLALGGLVPMVAWVGGITRLPAGSTPEIGLYLIALGSLAALLGLGLEVLLDHPPLATP